MMHVQGLEWEMQLQTTHRHTALAVAQAQFTPAIFTHGAVAHWCTTNGP